MKSDYGLRQGFPNPGPTQSTFTEFRKPFVSDSQLSEPRERALA